jgi:Excinuclease ATPase subunit
LGFSPLIQRNFLEILQAFVNTGCTVIVIEHNLDVGRTADWIVDMGPEGGSEGGKIIAEGPPEKVAETEKSYTGKFLKNLINNKMKKTA